MNARAAVRNLSRLLNVRTGIAFLACAALASACPVSAQTGYKFDSATVSGLPARNIGSAAMSGRIAAVDAVDQDGRITVFVGSASGGVWKSVNGGTTYKPVFDRESVQSIGAVAIDPSNPKTVWVGTGEAWMRNSVSVGDGVYKSTDNGENWTNVGLKDSEHIAKILVDPNDGNSVVVCATGHAWDDSDAGGVFKTADGGKTWKRVLAGANGSSGCSLLAMSRQEPKTIYAAMWDFRREGWTFRSGGPGSGLFKSTDGGDRWSEINDGSAKGLPPKPWGRVAVAVAPAKPQVVYANIESEKGRGLYRSDDGGANWTKLDASNFMVWRPFYFGNLIVDPKDENKIFKPDLILLYSTDGGKSFNVVSGGAHGDFHDVLDRSQEHKHRDCRRRRRPLAQRGWRQPLEASDEPAVFAVLPRQHRQLRSLPCLRRPAGQQFVGRRLFLSGRRHQFALGEYVRRRRILDV